MVSWTRDYERKEKQGNEGGLEGCKAPSKVLREQGGLGRGYGGRAMELSERGEGARWSL